MLLTTLCPGLFASHSMVRCSRRQRNSTMRPKLNQMPAVDSAAFGRGSAGQMQRVKGAKARRASGCGIAGQSRAGLKPGLY